MQGTGKPESKHSSTKGQPLLGSLFDSINDAIFIIDLLGNIKELNRTAWERLGYSKEELLARSVIDLDLPEFAARVPERMAQLKKQGAAVFESAHVHKDGKVMPVEISAKIIKYDDGKAILCMVRDISSRKQAEEELRQSEARFRAIIDESPVPYALNDEQSNITYLNKAFINTFGYDLSDIPTLADWWPKAYPDHEYRQWVEIEWRVRQGKSSREGTAFNAMELDIRCKDGSTRTVLASAVSLQKTFEGEHLVILFDISSQKQAETALRQSERRFRQLADNVHEVFWLVSSDLNEVQYVNPAYEAIWGRSCQSLYDDPRSWLEAVIDEDRNKLISDINKKGADDLSDSAFPEYRIARPDGSVRWIQANAFPVKNERGETFRIAGVAEDITERKEAEDMVKRLAHFDSLTGLPNRVLFMDRMRQALAQAYRTKSGFSLLFLDLDGFKAVNDSLGHEKGDYVLKLVAEHLQGCVRQVDTVARLGGDEFTIILPDTVKRDLITIVADKFLATLNEPIHIEGKEYQYHLGASIGVAIYPDDGDDLDLLINHADSAMYSAKENGKANYQFYTPTLNEEVQERLAIKNGLLKAVEREEFDVYFQPKLNLKSGIIESVEALMRWKSKDLGDVPPMKFINTRRDYTLTIPNRDEDIVQM